MATDMIHLIGAGGHGRVVIDALIAGGVDPAVIVVRDARTGLTILGSPVATPEIINGMAGEQFHVAVGSTSIRAQLQVAALAIGARPLNIVHPAAVISSQAKLGDGMLAAANSVIAPGSSIGQGTIVNHGAVVDHDCRIGDFCHIAPNATLGGEVAIGNRVMIGAGATILPGLTIADDVTIGAGAVVTCSIGVPGIWVGIPARKLVK